MVAKQSYVPYRPIERKSVQNQLHELEVMNHALSRELTLGKRIHEILLCTPPPKYISGINIVTFSMPTEEIAGDFFDFYQPAPEIFDIVLGDVMGRGMSSALIGTAVKTQLLRFTSPRRRIQVYQNTPLTKAWQDDICTPNEIIDSLKKEMTSALMQLEFCISLFYGRFDLQRRIFSYVDCGFAKPIHYQAQKNQVEFLEGRNLPLGILKEETHQLHSTSFDASDWFLFYSDGLLKAVNEKGEPYGKERLSEFIKKHHRLSSEQFLEEWKKNC